ncbi:MAG: 3-dehydroquinate dehydratase [Proteobacteria bacterium]|nr:3-dehydroquinate dehydratase [Pseudomonadota bacterium]
MTRILVLHGPNLNLLGEREPSVYGTMTLARLNAKLRAEAKRRKASLRVYQSNSEGRLIDLLHSNRKWLDGLLINPGAFTHYSYALHDAIAAVNKPAVEVHLSNIMKREPWRRVSVIEPACDARFMGEGADSYLQGLRWLAENAGR